MIMRTRKVMKIIKRGDRFTRGGHGGRGRGGRNYVQCQVCHKIGHDAFICFHRFKRDYIPPNISTPNPQANSYNSSWNSANTYDSSPSRYQNSNSHWQANYCPIPWSYSAWQCFSHMPHGMPQPPTHSLCQHIPTFYSFPWSHIFMALFSLIFLSTNHKLW